MVSFNHNNHSFGFSEEDLKFIGEIMRDAYFFMTTEEQRHSVDIINMIDLMLSIQPKTKTVAKKTDGQIIQRKSIHIDEGDWAMVDLSKLCKICRKFHARSEPCR